MKEGSQTGCNTHIDIQDLWKDDDLKTHGIIQGHVDCRKHSSGYQRGIPCTHL